MSIDIADVLMFIAESESPPNQVYKLSYKIGQLINILQGI